MPTKHDLTTATGTEAEISDLKLMVANFEARIANLVVRNPHIGILEKHTIRQMLNRLNKTIEDTKLYID